MRAETETDRSGPGGSVSANLNVAYIKARLDAFRLVLRKLVFTFQWSFGG